MLVTIPAKAKPSAPSDTTVTGSNSLGILPPTDTTQNDNDENEYEDQFDRTQEPEEETPKPNKDIQEETESAANQKVICDYDIENSYRTGDILTKKILIITSIVFVIASISLWAIFNKRRKN